MGVVHRSGLLRSVSARWRLNIWSIIVYLLVPYVLARLVWRALRYPKYWLRWPERFGFLAPLDARRTIWVHAVSVGEVRSVAPLVAALGERYEEHRLVVTTMTPTGSDQVRALFGKRVSHCYLPYDLPFAVRRFFDQVRPELAIVTEAEFWPNVFAECAKRRIPLILVNGRLSPSSLRAYMRVPQLVRIVLRNASLLCAQSEADAQRLRALGAPDRLLRVTGNMKFDAAVPAVWRAAGRVLRGTLGEGRPVLVAGSTHEGEEAQILAAFARLLPRFPDLLLMIVPREAERFQVVARLARRQGLRVALRSRTPNSVERGTHVLVGDTMGELPCFYAASDVAFVGGSLVRHGGHNPIEACAAGVPTLFGPHMFNFDEIASKALESGAACLVRDVDGLAEAVARYLEDPELRREAGRAARMFVAENRGALAMTLRLIDEVVRTKDEGRLRSLGVSQETERARAWSAG